MKITIKELKTIIKETVDKKKKQEQVKRKQLLDNKKLTEELFGITESDTNVNIDTDETVTEGSFKNLALGATLAAGLTGGAIANQTVRSNHNSAAYGAIHRIVDSTNSRTSGGDMAWFIRAPAGANQEEIEKLLVQKLKTEGNRFLQIANQSDSRNIGFALRTLANESLTLTDQEKELVRSFASRLR